MTTTDTCTIYRVIFRQEFDLKDYTEATIALREAIGQVKSLSDSLMGKNPTCAETIKGFDKRKHAEMRKFRTQQEEDLFKAYMPALIDATDGDTKPYFSVFEFGFAYLTASRSALIVFDRMAGYIVVHGWAEFGDPCIVIENLEKKGFNVSIAIIK